MFRHRPYISLLLFFSCALVGAQTLSPLTVDGVVHDATGAVIRGAVVNLQAGAFQASTTTDDRGRFSFTNLPQPHGTVEVSAQGFIATRKPWTAANNNSIHLDIALEPASTKEEVIVSAARAELRLSETPVSTVLLSSEDLNAAPSVRTDDVLREVPGFSLFRRSGSRTANPSTQGVSLRGLGGSATSRALVLADGISLVDPFGGWVYWDRVPRTAISTVEVVRGGASNLYGSDAMAGVVQFLMRQPEAPAFTLETSYGNEQTPDLSLWTGSRIGKWDYSASTEMFRTDGFLLVPFADRGPVDKKANVEDATVYARIGRELPHDGRVFLRGNYFTEFRHNGTTLQTNDTKLGEGAAGLDQSLGKSDSLSIRIYGDSETYHQTYSSIKSVNGPRDTETLTDAQHVPEQIAGGGAQWTHLLGKSQTLIAGMDMNEVIGASGDLFFTGSNQAQVGSGRQRAVGWFGEDIFQRQKWTVIAAARVDDWSNFRGTNICRSGFGSADAHAICRSQKARVQSAPFCLARTESACVGDGLVLPRLPRAHAQRTLSPLPRRRDPDAQQPAAHRRATDGRGSGRERRGLESPPQFPRNIFLERHRRPHRERHHRHEPSAERKPGPHTFARARSSKACCA